MGKLPVHAGLCVEDVRTLEVDDRDSIGGRGVFVNLTCRDGTCETPIREIPPESG